jgi:RNA polymerase primary sigma factor
MAAQNSLLDLPESDTRTRRSEGARPFPRLAALDEGAKGQIYRQWRKGVSTDVLATQFERSRASIERVICEIRARRILEQKLEAIYDPSFDERGAEKTILAPVPSPPGAKPQAVSKIKPPAGLPPYLASLYDNAPLLGREQEAHLFRKMNYLKYRASKLRERLDPARARTAELDAIERLQEEALVVKNQIIRANLRLVVSIAKKRVGPTNNFFELVSDGNMSLIRAVEKFDFSRGFKFSTYASWAIMKNFARSIPEEKQRRDRFVTGHDEMFEAAADHRADQYESENDHRRNQETVQGMLGRLNDRERQILVSRYGIGGASELTLEQLGRELGITKERVRQIESRAQEKLRKFAMEQRIDPPVN